ncbi:alkylhydroperoxidase AhpD family core domain-containing protein [Chitinophaga rupis]|uniref:Alkylhydroperoxidase AhpD family core domain-containing protein n=1 Tax=Chitinophaga rupis TaxID=573321 RepID=A0A1H8KKY2_9BACT|nr:carboxymuconolactone decarboxylase family protein [Chitinophaga rupis]SEN93477.1 alkylhydroperoxidase AhpD family core domain-containing protein [Chitinophaga rupis]
MEHSLRLASIEKPQGLYLKLSYQYFKKMLGKVITPAKVIYARVPRMMKIASLFYKIQQEATLPEELKILCHMLVSDINQCSFCLDIAQAYAMKQGKGMQKLGALHAFDTDPLFTPAERACLQYVKEVTLHKSVPDEVFKTLQQYFNDEQIIYITFLCASEGYYNTMNLALGIGSDGLCSLQ